MENWHEVYTNTLKFSLIYRHLPREVSTSTHALSNSFSKISNHRNPTPVVAIFHHFTLFHKFTIKVVVDTDDIYFFCFFFLRFCQAVCHCESFVSFKVSFLTMYSYTVSFKNSFFFNLRSFVMLLNNRWRKYKFYTCKGRTRWRLPNSNVDRDVVGFSVYEQLFWLATSIVISVLKWICSMT